MRKIGLVGISVFTLLAGSPYAGQQREQYEMAEAAWRSVATQASDPAVRACALRQAEYHGCLAKSLTSGSNLSCTRPAIANCEQLKGTGSGVSPGSLPASAAPATSSEDAIKSALDSLFAESDRRAAERKSREAADARRQEEVASRRSALALAIEREMERSRAANKETVGATKSEIVYPSNASQWARFKSSLSKGLSPAFASDTGQWSPWFYLQGTSGNVLELEIAFWYGDTTLGVPDAPIRWAIRSSLSTKARLVYELAVQCADTCESRWERYEVLLDGSGAVVRPSTMIQAMRIDPARVVALELMP
jgi:hypothetical protein